MEVGAVKQAYNNEVIHLKKKLNQAKIQIIHKLTRKAKTLTQKKCPENIQEKLNKKAKSAIEEVLVLKKITHKELAKFAITHKGQLNDYLNKPIVDKDKACARLLLHKCLEDKYTFFRSRFSNIPIGDLVMSREERRKLKKEEREKQKNKKKAKEKKKNSKLISSEGDWSVDDIDIDNLKYVQSNTTKINNDDGSEDSNSHSIADETQILNNNDDDDKDENEVRNNNASSDSGSDVVHKECDTEENNLSDNEQHSVSSENDIDQSCEIDDQDEDKIVDDESESSVHEEMETGEQVEDETKTEICQKQQLNKNPPKKDNRKKLPKKVKDSSKVKKFSEKIQSKKSKKDVDVKPAPSLKVIDPFFITSAGDNYMSLAEPKAPDVLDVNRRGNRQMRRAQLFGHDLNFKPRRNNDFGNRNNFGYKNNNFKERGNKFEKKSGFRRDRNKDYRSGFQKEDSNFNNSGSRHERGGFNDNRRQNFNDRNVPQFKPFQRNAEPEKLHPSWEAKKKKSGILPFEGKKIVFD